MTAADSDASRLARIGAGDLDLREPLPQDARILRVVERHRAGYVLHDGEATHAAQPAPHFLKRSVDPVDRPAVGDFVIATLGSPTVIQSLLPRRSCLIRREAGEAHRRQVIASNIDVAFVLCGLDGDFNAARIERYLLLIRAGGVEPVVVLTKADRHTAAEAMAELAARIAEVRVVAVNAKEAASAEPLLAWLGPGRTGVLVGSSGAGKSTLTNTLLGESRQATAGVRAHDSRGRHTTTHRALLMLPSGGCLIDTPGMRELKPTGEEDIADDGFADVEELASRCRFGDCAHDREPGCAVRAALESGDLDEGRWRNYLKLRGEVEAAADAVLSRLGKKSAARPLRPMRRERP